MHEFPNLTNNLAINFCNTQILRQGKLIDLFHSLDQLKLWLEVPIENEFNYNRELSVMYSCLNDDVKIADIKKLREEVMYLLSIVSTDLTNIELVKEEIESFMSINYFTLIFVDNEPFPIPIENGIKGMKVLLYLSLASLIRSQELMKLTKCANSECQLYFINQTGRRKWCSMKLCGNRNKVDTFLNKQKARKTNL